MRRLAAVLEGVGVRQEISIESVSCRQDGSPQRRHDEPGKAAAAGRIRVRTFALEVAAPRSNPLMLRRRISGRASASSTQLRAHFQSS
jgi:hypothetical protein